MGWWCWTYGGCSGGEEPKMRLAPCFGGQGPNTSWLQPLGTVRACACVCVVCAFIMASVPYCVPGGGCGRQTPAFHLAGPTDTPVPTSVKIPQ